MALFYRLANRINEPPRAIDDLQLNSIERAVGLGRTLNEIQSIIDSCRYA